MALLAAAVLPGAGPAAAAAPDLSARAAVMALADARRFDRAEMTRLSGSADVHVRRDVARLAGELANPRAVPLMQRLATDRAPAVRAACAAAAGRLAATLPPRADAAPLGAIVRTMLDDEDAGVRAAAAWAAGAGGFPGAAEWLAGRLGTEGVPAVRAAILDELWRVNGADVVTLGERGLGAVEPEVRRAAARSLARSANPDAAGPLGTAAQDDDPLVRAAVLEGGRRLGDGALWQQITAGVADSDARVRIAALTGLAAEVAPGEGRVLSAAVTARVAAIVVTGDPARAQERVAAIGAAGAAGCCARELTAVVSGHDGWAAGAALTALARQRAPGAAKLVGEWLDAADARRRVAGVGAARSLADAAQRIAPRLADESAAVRLAAVEAAAAVGGADLVAALDGRLGDGDPAVRAAAVDALVKLGAAPDTATLLGLLGREQGRTVPDAAVSLVGALARGKTLAPEVRSALETLAASPDPVVARAAWQALRAHGDALALPAVATGEKPSFYRTVAAWAQEPRWLEIVTVRGTLQVALDTDDAPLTAWRLAKLADEHYFDTLTFHRVVPDFVVQGGDPRGDGWGGPPFVLRDELSLEPYAAGAVGLALAGPDTGGSQLFVTLTPQPHLDGRYPYLGRVTAGLDVAGRIQVGDRILAVHAGSGPRPVFYPVWYGRLDPGRLDAEIPGWEAERLAYQPRESLLALLGSARLRYGIVAVMGTWCSDSREQIPRLLAVLDALGRGSPFESVTLVGVDRSKAVDPRLFPYGPVDRVPTIVITVEGSEIGRIVETPTSGSIEEDVARILASVEGFAVPPTP